VGCEDSRAVAAYSAARGAAQHGYVRSVGAEVAAFGVNVIATAQTFVENPTYFLPATEDFKQRMQGVPAGRLSTGREAAMFLLAVAGPESDRIFGPSVSLRRRLGDLNLRLILEGALRSLKFEAP
jgi:NAD(P)-dependent dehydrogenase (short-subunit alcohol dehydrogenase family)